MNRPASRASNVASSVPTFEPMLATLTDQRQFPGSKGTWLFERKLDGIRALAIRKGDVIRLVSRNGNELGTRYPEIVEALRHQAVKDFAIDGEIVAVQGRRISFQNLQQRLMTVSLEQARQSKVRIAFYVFDLLWVNGFDVRQLPLHERKRLLKQAITFSAPIYYTPHRLALDSKTLQAACRDGWEGFIAKRADSRYVGGRSRDWLKVKCGARQEFVIGGYTDPQGSRPVLGALLVGYYEKEKLLYAGRVGTGFSDETLEMFGKKLAALATERSPFAPDPELPRKGMHWVKPKLVAEVEFAEWTHDRKLRHPRFIGLRTDKRAAQVVRERAVDH
ncbi:MAG: non-homologous end-joining DNA ligase [Phycisphaerales bacterium]|nr:non-homologous end-joining DNA ligase [Phycisphaerales bacterium]MCI0631108.1 non-homologous end-joining DNA ligase [Phycisphaerales bacterium]MCI0675434.1 non-homologous end-joining DNA ligase [Phycisphaerales bacterium]